MRSGTGIVIDRDGRIAQPQEVAVHTRTIVTAANHRYARTLTQLLLSAERHARQVAVVVFDLGLARPDRAGLARRFPYVRVETFSFDSHPAHVRELATCAWKPAIIERALEAQCGLLLWLDAASVIRAPLDEAFHHIEQDGILTLAGQAPAARWCHERTLTLMEVPPVDLLKRCRVGGVIGFDSGRPVVRDLVARWRELALNRDYIDPPGAHRGNHRYDQALLTNLLHAFERERGLVLRDDEVDISSVDPVRWVSTRNTVPYWMPLWLDPAVRAYYRTWKSLDRAWHSLTRS